MVPTIFAMNQFEFLSDIKQKTGQKIETVALLYENTECIAQGDEKGTFILLSNFHVHVKMEYLLPSPGNRA